MKKNETIVLYILGDGENYEPDCPPFKKYWETMGYGRSASRNKCILCEEIKDSVKRKK